MIIESQIWGGWIKITMRTFFPRFPKRWNFSILQVFVINSTADWVGCPCPVSCFLKIAFIKWNYQDAAETVIHKVINRLNCFKPSLHFPLSPRTLPGRKVNYHCECSPHCVCTPPAIIEECLAALGWGEGLRGREWVVCAHAQHPLLLGLKRAIFLRALQRPSSMLLVPQPKRRSLTWETSLLTNWGKLELPTGGSTTTAPGTRARHLLSTVPTLLNTGPLPARGTPGWPACSPSSLQFLGYFCFRDFQVNSRWNE